MTPTGLPVVNIALCQARITLRYIYDVCALSALPNVANKVDCIRLSTHLTSELGRIVAFGGMARVVNRA